MLEAFVWGSGGRKLSPAEAAREKEIAEALLAGAIDTSPVGHWLQGAARMGQALSGKIREGRANKASDEGRSAYTAKFNEVLSGASDPVASVASSLVAPSSPSPSPAPAPSASAPSVKISGSKQEFVNALLPAAIEESKRTGVDPRIIVAQAAQETGWGRAAPGNNYFGIKSHGKGGGQNLKTHEYVNGKRVNITDSFRKFKSPADSVRGYGDFILTNPRYKPFREAQGLDAQLEALQASGYATDPKYSQSVGAIARGIQLPVEPTPAAPMSSPGLPDEAFNARFDMGVPAPEMIDGGALPQAQAYAAERGGLSMPAMPVRSSGLDMMTGQPARVDPVQSVAASLTNSLVNPELPMAGNTSGFLPVQQAQAQSGPSMQQLIELASDPWANDAQRGIAQALLTQQMQANDPMRQLDMEYKRAQIAKMMNEGSGPTEFGLTPQFGVDANGNPVLLQLGKDGRAVQTAIPEGVSLSREPIRLDAGTHFVLLDPITRQPVGQVPKNLREAAAESSGGTVEGRVAAETSAAADADYQAGLNALDILNQIENHPGLSQGTGIWSYGNIIPGTSGYDFQNIVEQAKSGAFLSAIQQLRGMGSLSNAEGSAATAAVTRMDTATSKEGFLSALRDYRKIVQQGMDRARGKKGSLSPNRPISEMTDEELEALANGNG